MAIMVMDMALNKKALAAIVFAILSANTLAGEWQFTPSLVLDETYSDNVNLSVNNNTSSLVSQTGIQLSSIFSSKKLEFTLASKSLYAMYSHDHNADDDFHTLNTNFRLKLAPKGLAFIGNAEISNHARNSSTNALADIVSGDTARVENYSSGLEYTINNSAVLLNSRFQYQTTISEDNIGERDGYTVQLTTMNGSSARHIYWEGTSGFSSYTNHGREGKLFTGEIKLGLMTNYKISPFLRYYDETNEGDLFNNNSSIESDSYGSGLRWLITPKLLLDISYNTPTGTQLDFDGEEIEDYTAASIRWEPSQRTLLTIDYGQRFYGESYGLNLAHKNKRLTNTITYLEDVKAFTRNNYESVAQGAYWCPQGEIIDTSSCFVSNDENINFDDYQLISLSKLVLVEDQALSLNKQLSWSSTLALPRTTFNLSISSLSRENLSTRIEDENQSASFSIKRKLSGKSNIQLSLGYTENHHLLKQDNEQQDRYRRYSLEYDKSLNSRLSVILGLSHTNRSSTTQSFNYEEDRVYLKVSKGF